MAVETIRLNEQYFAECDKVINAINKLDKNGAFDERIELLVLAMTYIQMAFNNLLQFKELTYKYDIESTKTYDYRVCSYAEKLYVQANKLINILTKGINGKKIPLTVSNQRKKQLLELAYKMMCMSARWHIERFINVYEFETEERNKAFPQRKPLLYECIFFADRMIGTSMRIQYKDGINPLKIIFAVQPNSGKSFVANVYSAISLCLHRLYYNTSGILRMSNNGTNALGFSEQVKNMIDNEKICDIYPEFKRYFNNGKSTILEKSTSEEWKIAGLDPKIRASFFARGRDSAINSIRIFVALVIDDLSDGFDQINNDEAHQAMNEKYEIDMESRKDNASVPEFILGTMFNEFDVPNQIISKLEKKGLLIYDDKFTNVRHTPDYSVVVIAVDCYDDKGRSVAPDLISTEKLKEKQESLKPYEFDLVYRQKRASREPRIFDYANLKTYDVLPDTLTDTAIGVLDPTRKNGNDYFSLPVFRHNSEDNLYYFTDCIYEQKSIGRTEDPKNKFLDKVVKFIIKNKLTRFTIENNTSNTIGTVIEEWLHKYNYFNCKIDEIFQVKTGRHSSKMQRILDQEACITANIVFPSLKILKPNTEMFTFMQDFTRYDAKQQSNAKNHDDAPDSIAIFSARYLFNRQNRYATISTFDKKRLFM